jgi:chorismate mutase/prephenate dehydratase
MSKKLENIRKKIDSLDHQIHDLLMARAALVSDVAEEKRKHGLQIVHPAREAMMIRRLLERHNSVLPEAAVVRIWRELVGAVSLLQSGLKVVVTDSSDSAEYWDMARNYFGSVIPMQKMSSPLLALAAVREGDASFAVVPWPEDMAPDSNPWWSHLMHKDVQVEDGPSQSPIQVVCALPYGSPENQDFSTLSSRALVVSRIDFRDSEDDNSFIGFDMPPTFSRAKLVSAMQSVGLEPLAIQTCSGAPTTAPSLHLVEIKGYVVCDDARLLQLRENLSEDIIQMTALGGYPVVPDYKALPNTIVSDPVFKIPSQDARKTG